MTAVADVFADTGLMAVEDGDGRRALAEFAVRLDLAGAGEFLTLATNLTCWAVDHGAGRPGCRCPEAKGTPNPQPTPPPPPQPTPPPQDPK